MLNAIVSLVLLVIAHTARIACGRTHTHTHRTTTVTLAVHACRGLKTEQVLSTVADLSLQLQYMYTKSCLSVPQLVWLKCLMRSRLY